MFVERKAERYFVSHNAIVYFVVVAVAVVEKMAAIPFIVAITIGVDCDESGSKSLFVRMSNNGIPPHSLHTHKHTSMPQQYISRFREFV